MKPTRPSRYRLLSRTPTARVPAAVYLQDGQGNLYAPRQPAVPTAGGFLEFEVPGPANGVISNYISFGALRGAGTIPTDAVVMDHSGKYPWNHRKAELSVTAPCMKFRFIFQGRYRGNYGVCIIQLQP